MARSAGKAPAAINPDGILSVETITVAGHYWIDNGEPGTLAHLAVGDLEHASHQARVLCGAVRTGAGQKSAKQALACARCVDALRFPEKRR